MILQQAALPDLWQCCFQKGCKGCCIAGVLGSVVFRQAARKPVSSSYNSGPEFSEVQWLATGLGTKIWRSARAGRGLRGVGSQLRSAEPPWQAHRGWGTAATATAGLPGGTCCAGTSHGRTCRQAAELTERKVSQA